MKSGLSIVTTTWNEGSTIAELICNVRTVLRGVQHEIIVVDDESPDGTLEIAKPLADIAVAKKREGQTKGLLYGMRFAKYPIIVTIDSDLENSPKHIPELAEKALEYDIVVASRTEIPRISEKIASKSLGRLIGVTDVFSNFRAYKKETVPFFKLKAGETFGAEPLVIAKKNGLQIGETKYKPPPRRGKPRIGGTVKANFRILWALLKVWTIYLGI
ncbi:MAG TPA: glycosyltransferase [Candidatus Sulfotelmatobacter sp.]|nr:glycosyltransferase [Candidatus Sulfotelmatobacter sp.]